MCDSISEFNGIEQLISQGGAVYSTEFKERSAKGCVAVETKSLRTNFQGVKMAKKKSHSVYTLTRFILRQIVRYVLTCNNVTICLVERYEHPGFESSTCCWNVSSSHWQLRNSKYLPWTTCNEGLRWPVRELGFLSAHWVAHEIKKNPKSRSHSAYVLLQEGECCERYFENRDVSFFGIG